MTATPQPTNLNQIILEQVAQAAAPPPSLLITEEIPINIPGILTASTARGQAQATYDPQFCPVGRPLTYGLGYVENAQVLPGRRRRSGRHQRHRQLGHPDPHGHLHDPQR